MGMPSYSFTCQTSYLTAMAKEGFDFNTCIYDGQLLSLWIIAAVVIPLLLILRK